MENTEDLLLEKENYINLTREDIPINSILELIRDKKINGFKELLISCKNEEERCDIKKELENLGYTTTCKIRSGENERSSFKIIYLQINW
jgi:hypothetical protein